MIRSLNALLLQTPAVPSKLSTVEARIFAQKNVLEAYKNVENRSLQLIILPEMFSQPYGVSYFQQFAEYIPNKSSDIVESSSPTSYFLSHFAKSANSWVVGGSVAELGEDNKVYNTSLVFNSDGEIVAKHRKIHLFDIDIPGKMTFRESDTLSAGNQITTFDAPWGKTGLCICYDVRFPEMFEIMRQEGVNVIVIPAAFNSTTGPLHWELLMRARAVDCQSYVLACAPARSSEEGAYPSHGHSMCVTPWGEVTQLNHHEEGYLLAQIDLSRVDEMRAGIPTTKQKRYDLYSLKKTNKL
eukprot:GDKJ01028614.1.p1 GENE.GDKJ01028614.1~~GDKJ01028614.1.p1  ORF type:complete len:298 (-),score=37.64 GDKJ01028614.1:180-1073(-)